jgi:hypothetical protein
MQHRKQDPCHAHPPTSRKYLSAIGSPHAVHDLISVCNDILKTIFKEFSTLMNKILD